VNSQEKKNLQNNGESYEEHEEKKRHEEKRYEGYESHEKEKIDCCLRR